MKIMLKKIIEVSILFISLSICLSANNSNLPDFTKLVDNNSASIVNISTVRKVKPNQQIQTLSYQMMSRILLLEIRF